jgi:membrane protein
LEGIDEIINKIVLQTHLLLEERRIRLLSIGLPALMVASNGMRAIMVTLNRAWSVREGRNLLQRYLLALALTVALAVIVIVSTAVMSRANEFSSWIASHWGTGWATAMWLCIQMVAVGALVFILELIYHLAPNVRRPWHWITPGSIFAVLLWLAGTSLFKLYVSQFGQYDVMYASLGAVVVFLLWLYIAGLAILVGGELNAELERSAGLIPSPAVPAPPTFDAAGHDTRVRRAPSASGPDAV